MAAYRFVTTWRFDAPIERVFAVLEDIGGWPGWWPAVRQAQALDDDLWRYTWRSRLAYDLTFDARVTRVDPPFMIEGRATGDLSGLGRCRLYEDQGTTVVYDWEVRTGRRWMDRLAPLARPVFVWNHDRVMRQGAEGLARELGVRLLAHC